MANGREGPRMDSILHLFHRAGQVADDLFATAMIGSDLTPRQYAVLAVLAKHENASQTDIVGQTGIDRSTLADIVKRLVDRGLLARRRSKFDARAYSVRLTAAGQAALRSTAPVAARVEEQLLKAVPVAKREEFAAALAAIVRGADGFEVPSALQKIRRQDASRRQ